LTIAFFTERPRDATRDVPDDFPFTPPFTRAFERTIVGNVNDGLFPADGLFAAGSSDGAFS
jgi:hypothetical protein